jgi:VWFA-related protein
VVVTDAKGQPVTGLTAADFELFEDGKPVAISNFYAVENGVTVELAEGAPETPEEAAPRRRPPHHVILYFDNANISPSNRGKALARLREFLLDHWREGMRVMVATNDGPAQNWGTAVRLGFTDVPHDVFVALDQLAGEATVGPRFDLDRRNILRGIEQVNVEAASGLFPSIKGSGSPVGDAARRESIVSEARSFLPQIRSYAQEYQQHVQSTLRVLDGFVETAAGLPGRKSILYVSDGLPLQPGYALFEAYTRRFAMVPALGRNVDPLLEANRFDTTEQFEALVAKANASRVTFYSLEVGPPAAASRGAADSRASSGGNFADWRDSYDTNLENNRQQSLVLMADGTGGRYGLGLTATEATLDGILQDMDNHYSLGYVADRREADRGREIKVRVKGREKLKIRHRSSLRDKTAAERAAEGAQALLLVDDPQRVALDDNPLGVALETRGEEPQEDGTVLVPLLVKIPLGKLVLLPGETEHVGRVSMFVAVRDEKGRTSQVNHHLCPIHIPNAEVLTALGQSAGCGVRLRMRNGPQRIAVAVLDETAALYSTISLDLEVGAAAAEAEQAALR